MSEIKIFVYEQFDSNNDNLMAYLYYDTDKRIFSFEFNDTWLEKTRFNYYFDPEIFYYRGRQYPEFNNHNIFGFLSDSMPDRWGRYLMQKNENITSIIDNKPRELKDIDFLLNVFDETRLGAIRFKLDLNEDYVSNNSGYSIPPMIRLRSLEAASLALEYNDEDIDKQLLLLLAPGSSLGGARPKANVIDLDNDIWIAKFPSRKDQYNVGAWEKTAYDLAKLCDINVADYKIENYSEYGSTFLCKRFDRNKHDRIHFASAMNLLNKTDGDSNNSYLELAEFIKSNCKNVRDNLIELYKRIIFNVLISNIDDHFRNHGFLLIDNGWNLSPFYDINPINYGRNLNTNIDLYNSNLDLDLVKSVCKYFSLTNNDADILIKNMKKIINKNWRNIAFNNGLNSNDINNMSKAFYLADLP